MDKLADKGVETVEVSGLWQSPSWPPGQGYPDFLNAVAKINWSGTAYELLEILQSIEQSFGRLHSERNAPRPLDLDILDFNGQIIRSELLNLPHPRMLDRGFVLLPLQQVSPNWLDPETGKAISDYIARLPLCDIEPMKYRGVFYEIRR